MTPAEHAALDHLRQACEASVPIGRKYLAVQAIHRLRDGVNQRDERETKIREVLRGVVDGRFTAVEGIAEIEAILDAIPPQRIPVDELGDPDYLGEGE